MFLLRLGNRFILKPQNNLTEGLSILFMVEIPIFLTIYLASMLQWVVIGERINWLGWSLQSAIVGTLWLHQPHLLLAAMPTSQTICGWHF